MKSFRNAVDLFEHNTSSPSSFGPIEHWTCFYCHINISLFLSISNLTDPHSFLLLKKNSPNRESIDKSKELGLCRGDEFAERQGIASTHIRFFLAVRHHLESPGPLLILSKLCSQDIPRQRYARQCGILTQSLLLTQVVTSELQASKQRLQSPFSRRTFETLRLDSHAAGVHKRRPCEYVYCVQIRALHQSRLPPLS